MPKIIEDAKVYRAVIETIMESGYASATTKLIAEAAGANEVTLFRKYGNKAELVRQAIIAIIEQIDFASVVRYTGNVSDDLLRIVEMYQGAAAENDQFFYTVILEGSRHPELADLLDAPLGLVSNIGQLLARYQEEGTLIQEHPFHAVASLLGPLVINNMLRSASTDIPFPPIDLMALVTNFLNGRAPLKI